jgi:hypothetical protein
MKNTKTRFVSLLALGILLSACASGPAVSPVINTDTLRQAGVEIDTPSGNSYLRLISANEKGDYGPVIIFIERHNSRLIQAEIALGMHRLSRDAGLKRIAREGMYEGETLQGYSLPSVQGVDSRYAALNLLEEGVLTAPEFMFSTEGSEVFGIEKQEEYTKDMAESEGSAYVYYQIAGVIADAGWEQAQPLIHTMFNNEDRKQRTDAFAALLKLSPWVEQTDAMLNTSLSSAALMNRLAELRDKCEPLLNRTFNDQGKRYVFIDDEVKEDFNGFIGFYETVRQRSLTIAENVLRILKNKNGPLALTAGSNHTEDIENYLAENGVRYYVLAPKEIWSQSDISDISNEAYMRRSRGEPLTGSSALKEFLMIGLMPRPLLTEDWTHKQAAIENLILKVGNAAVLNADKASPFGLSADELQSEEIRVIPETIEKLNDGSIMLGMESKGQILYFRSKTTEGYNPADIAALPDMEAALVSVIERLSAAPAGPLQTPPAAAFNLPAAKIACAVAPSPELIRNAALTITQ